MIGPTDLFHPSPAPHLKTFQVLLMYCPKLKAYPHAFSLRCVGVITGETWTLLSPLPPAVRYVLWDHNGILLTEFMAPGATITSELYCEMMNKLRRAIQKDDAGCSLKASFCCKTTICPTLRIARPPVRLQPNLAQRLRNPVRNGSD